MIMNDSGIYNDYDIMASDIDFEYSKLYVDFVAY